MTLLFAKTFLIGLSIAAPVGPIGLLCIDRTLRRGPAVGLATGMGAAVADAVYGTVGVLGTGAVLAMLLGLRPLVAGLGALFLLWLAWSIWRSEAAAPAAPAAPDGAGGAWGAFAGTFLLTLSNPATILSFMSIFAALAPPGDIGSGDKAIMIAGVFAGSAAWWLFLVGGVSRIAALATARIQRAVRRLSACVLAGFGVWQLLSLATG